MRAFVWLTLTTTLVSPPGEVEIQRPTRIEPVTPAPPEVEPVTPPPVEIEPGPAEPLEPPPTQAPPPVLDPPPASGSPSAPPPAVGPVAPVRAVVEPEDKSKRGPPLRGAGLWISGAFATGLGAYIFTELALSDPFGGKGLFYGGASFLTLAGAGAYAGGTVLYVRHRRWVVENMGAPPKVEAGMPLLSVGLASLGAGFPMLIYGAFGNLGCQPQPYEELITESCFRGPRTRLITGATLSSAGLVLSAVGAFYSFRHKRELKARTISAAPYVAPDRFGVSVGLAGRF